MKKIFILLMVMFFVQKTYSATYFLQAPGNMTVLANWNSLANGTGTVPLSFTGIHTWNIHNIANVSLNATFSVSGGAIVNIGDGINPTTLLYTGGVAKFGTGAPPTINITNGSTFVLDQLYSGYSTNKTNFNAGSTFSCGLGSDQVPGDVYSNLVIAQDVYLPAPSTVQAAFSINTGHFLDLDVITLTLNGTILSAGGTILGNNYGGSLVLGGTGNMGTLNFTPGSEVLTNLTLNMANATSFVNLSSDLLIDDGAAFGSSLNLTNGGLKLNGFSLTTSALSTFGGGAALIYGDPNSIINIQSPTMSGNLTMDATSNMLKALNLNSTGSLGLGSPLNILDSVKINGATLSTGGNLNLKATTALKGRIAEITGGGSISGNVNAETLAPGPNTGWALLGAGGVSGQSMASWYGQFPMSIEGSATGVTSAGGYFESVQGWDETDAYGYDTTITIGTALTPGKAFWTYLGTGQFTTSDILITLSGAPVTGPVNIPLTNSAQSGTCLIANPYASPIRWSLLRNGNASVANAIYIYNADGGYASFVNGTGANGGSDIIPVGQGFFVEANSATNLTAQESNKVSSNTALMKSSSSAANVGLPIKLKLNGFSSETDETVIRFHGSATNAYDLEWDARKIFQTPGYVGYPGGYSKYTTISTKNGSLDYSINSLPYALTQNAVIPVLVKVMATGQYTITGQDMQLLPPNSCVTLKDKLLNITHNIKASPYVFSMNDTTSKARFELTVCADITTGINNNSTELSLDESVMINNDANGVYVNLNFDKTTKTRISVTNILGQKIVDNKSITTQNDKVYLGLESKNQLIFVTVETENNKVTKKIIH